MAVPAERVSPITRLTRQSDIVLALAAVGTLAMVVIPLPFFLLSMLLILSLTFALVSLLITMYTTEPLNFSVFPSLIILLTVFRLALNVSTTRSILAHAYAGQVVEVFGSFVVGGNYVVGFVIFLIIVLVNYLVVANGAVRIGEVAARFTLDAMPGKQMGIDADLNSGLITEDEAKSRRARLDREADFFGAMDGASRFVQRDAMAGLIIVFINTVGGFIIGMVQRGMPLMEALTTYTRLTVGDGLLASLPALLMSTAAGIMVTNAVSEANLGQDMTRQILSQPRVISVVSVVLLFFGIIPGMPKLPFLVLAALVGGLAYALQQSARVEKVEKAEEEKRAVAAKPPESVVSLLQVDILELEIGYALIPLVDVEQGGDLLDRVTMIRRQCALDLGLVVPPIRIRDNMQLKPPVYSIKIKGVEVARGEVMLEHYLAMNPGEVTEEIEGEKTKEPAFGLPAVWIASSQKERAESLGYTVVDCTSVIATHLTEVIRSHAAEILGRQEVQSIVDNLKQTYPAVVEELIPNLLTIGEVQKVLQNLLRERVSIRDMVTILETLADYAKQSKDMDILTEYVRASLSRSICQQYQNAEGKIAVVTLDPNLEQKISEAIQQTPQGAYLALEPNLTQKILSATSAQVEKMVSLGYPAVILCSIKVRLHLRRLVERILPNLVVLSYNEIIGGVQIQSVGMVSVE